MDDWDLVFFGGSMGCIGNITKQCNYDNWREKRTYIYIQKPQPWSCHVTNILVRTQLINHLYFTPYVLKKCWANSGVVWQQP
jgi:hypothetical protein